jgi:hypothetical protein
MKRFKCSECKWDLAVEKSGNDDMSMWNKKVRTRPKFKKREIMARVPATVMECLESGLPNPGCGLNEQVGKLPRTQARVMRKDVWTKEKKPICYHVVLRCKRHTCRKSFEWIGRSKSQVMHRVFVDMISKKK